MTQTATIARPYAEAAFRLAKEQGRLAAWSDMLAFAGAVAADERMRARIADPNLAPAQLEALFVGLCGERLDRNGQNFIHILVENHRLFLLPEIAQLFERLRADAEGVLDARIVSAFPLSDAQVRGLVSRLEDKYQRKVNAVVEVDDSLIGGVTLYVGDQVLDNSVRAQLQSMASALTR